MTDALPAGLLDADAVADLLKCSRRHVTQLDADGLMPASILLGRQLRRWSAAVIEQWCRAGCPDRMEWDALRGDAT